MVPQLVSQHGFTSTYDLNKHKTRESYVGLPLSEERLGGEDDPSAHRDQGFAGGRPWEHWNEMITCKCMCVSVVRGWYRCLHVSPLACMRCNLEANVPCLFKRGTSPSRLNPLSLHPRSSDLMVLHHPMT